LGSVIVRRCLGLKWQQLIRAVSWQAAGIADATVQGPEPAHGNVSKATATQTVLCRYVLASLLVSSRHEQ
jgi:hypothetical protein